MLNKVDGNMVQSAIAKLREAPPTKQQLVAYKEAFIDDTANRIVAAAIESGDIYVSSAGDVTIKELVRKAYHFAQIAWEEKLRSNPHEFAN